jgi:formylglycine-generating enzyme required for sulfatase activity
MGDSSGDGRPQDGEGPPREVDVEGFAVDVTTVTNADFEVFVQETGHRTEAEEFGFSAVFRPTFRGAPADVVGVPQGTPWWLAVRGADWRHPEGRASHVRGREEHPVVHVSWNDAQAYCRWADRRLPSEAEWEYASRGGLVGRRYPWGDELLADDGSWRCNIWQGRFPVDNTAEDGFVTTAPVRTYQPNAWGLWQTVGNVWEWCEDAFVPTRSARAHPTEVEADGGEPPRVIRGGSFLCHDSYCNRYRNSARSANTPDSSTANTGFRTVRRA